jgi:hypothetical protein
MHIWSSVLFVRIVFPVSVLTSDRDRRGAQRLALPKPVPATFGGFPGNLVEFSLTGCRFEHVDRLTLHAQLPLRFSWRGKPVRLTATVVRSEMSAVGRKTAYTSGLEFCESVDEAPSVIREVVAWLADAAAKKSPVAKPVTPAPAPTPGQVPFLNLDDEPETLSAPYLQCTLAAGKWSKVYVDAPEQPANGFTIAAPSDESEADVLCRAYEKAKGEARRAMRQSFEQAIAKNKRSSS